MQLVVIGCGRVWGPGSACTHNAKQRSVLVGSCVHICICWRACVCVFASFALQLRFAAIQSQLSPFLASCGFKDSSVQWLPAIGPTGDNLTQPPAQDSGLGSWWQGPTLVQAIDTFKSRERLTGG